LRGEEPSRFLTEYFFDLDSTRGTSLLGLESLSGPLLFGFTDDIWFERREGLKNKRGNKKRFLEKGYVLL